MQCMELKEISGKFIPQLKQGVFFPQEDKNGIYWFFDDILNRDSNYNVWSKSDRIKLYFKLIGE